MLQYIGCNCADTTTMPKPFIHSEVIRDARETCMDRPFDSEAVVRVAQEMARVHGAQACHEARARSRQALWQGDEEGFHSWRLILRSIEILQLESCDSF